MSLINTKIIDLIDDYKDMRQLPASIEKYLKLEPKDDPFFNPEILYNPQNEIDKKILKIIL